MENDEIDLMDYVLVLIKRKWTIIAIFLIAVITVGIFSFLAEKVYKIDTVLEIGKVEEPGNIISKIHGDVYGIIIREKLQIAEREYLETKASNPDKTRLVVLEIESADIELAQIILQQKEEIIIQEYEQKLETEIELIQRKITTTEQKLAITENDISRLKNHISLAEQEKQNLEDKIAFLQRLITQDIGSEFALINTKEELAKKQREIQDLYSRINNLEKTLEDYNTEITSLNLSLKDIEDYKTRVIKPVTVSEDPVKPNKKLNVAIAGILGLFIGVFVAFSREWWFNNRNKL